MYNFRSEEEIKRDMLNNISNTEDKSENSFIHDAIAPAAIEFQNAYVELEYVGGKINVDNLEGLELETFVKQRTGIKRKLATKALTTLNVSGVEGAKVSKGDLFSTDSGIDFVTVEGVVLNETGMAKVIVVAILAGSTGNVPINAISEMPVAINGIVDVYNETQVLNGYDDETDNELRERYYEKLQKPGKSGNKYHYLEWAKEVVGVGGAKVIPRWDGPLTIKVVIIDSNGQPASEELITDTFEHIESERPFGANTTVISAIPIEVNISVTLLLLEGVADVEVKEVIKNNIKDYLKTMAFKVPYISYAQIGSIVLDTEGVLDYSDLKVNLATANIEVASEEVAIVGGVS